MAHGRASPVEIRSLLGWGQELLAASGAERAVVVTSVGSLAESSARPHLARPEATDSNLDPSLLHAILSDKSRLTKPPEWEGHRPVWAFDPGWQR